MSDWITHDGKGCPVEGDDRYLPILTQHAYGQMAIAEAIAWSVSWTWDSNKRHRKEWDIIAYQVIKPYKPDAAAVAPPATPLKKS